MKTTHFRIPLAWGTAAMVAVAGLASCTAVQTDPVSVGSTATALVADAAVIDAGPKKVCCVCRTERTDAGGIPIDCLGQQQAWQCDFAITERVASSAECYTKPVVFPDGCTEQHYLNACHGSPNQCDAYVAQFQAAINAGAGTCQTLTFDTSSCSLAGDLSHFLTQVQQVCASETGCSISANQTTVYVDPVTGVPLTTTLVTVCVGGPDAGVTFGSCGLPKPTCGSAESGETYTCSNAAGGTQQYTCCQSGPTAYGWESGNGCPPYSGITTCSGIEPGTNIFVTWDCPTAQGCGSEYPRCGSPMPHSP